MIDVKDFTYKGVTVTIQRRPNCGHSYEFGYKTSNDITGIGQDSDQAAAVAAKRAIDQHIKEEPPTCHRCGDALGENWVEVWKYKMCEYCAVIADYNLGEFVDKLTVPDEEFEAWLKEQG